jgi:YbgC/YbaW family acyl-CoA thioester hydrolase
MKVIETPIQKRFADIDVFGHVNNINQQAYLDLGKTDYYNQVIGFDVFTDRLALMIVSVKSDFVEQIRYADETVVKTWVERIGTKSVTIRQQIITLAGDGAATLCTESETVLVAFDRKEQRTVEIPDGWRNRII